MSAAMQHQIPLSKMQAQWFSRELPELHYYTLGVTYVLSAVLLGIGARVFVQHRRTARALAANPSTRAAILHAQEQHTLAATRGIWAVSLLFLVCALPIWGADAGIGAVAAQRDAPNIPWSTEPAFLIAFALQLGGIILWTVAGLTLLPLAQIALVARWLRRSAATAAVEGRTLADRVPEARIVATYVGQSWAFAFFQIVSWWPIGGTYSLARYFCLMSAWGSALVWMDASHVFNFRAERLEDVELAGLSKGVGPIVRMFGRQVLAVHDSSKSAVLPIYEDVKVQTVGVTENEIV